MLPSSNTRVIRASTAIARLTTAYIRHLLIACTLSSLYMSARRDASTDGIDLPGAQSDYQRDAAFVISTQINKCTLIPILTSYVFIPCPEQQEPVSRCERHDMI